MGSSLSQARNIPSLRIVQRELELATWKSSCSNSAYFQIAASMARAFVASSTSESD